MHSWGQFRRQPGFLRLISLKHPGATQSVLGDVYHVSGVEIRIIRGAVFGVPKEKLPPSSQGLGQQLGLEVE